MAVSPVLLTTRVLCVFAAVIAVLLTAVPKPLRDIDYVIVGAVGTFAALLVIFGTVAGNFTRDRIGRRNVLPLDERASSTSEFENPLD